MFFFVSSASSSSLFLSLIMFRPKYVNYFAGSMRVRTRYLKDGARE